MPFERNDKIKRWIHSPLTVEHNGINASIKEDGKVVLNKSVEGTEEFDEIEVPASLIFKLAQLLKATRKVKYVNVSDVDSSKS